MQTTLSKQASKLFEFKINHPKIPKIFFQSRKMRKTIIFLLAVMLPLAVMAKKEKKAQEVDSLGNKIKTGWNFGILPSIAYDAD